MNFSTFLGLTFSEMGLDITTTAVIILAAVLFIAGFIKSSKEMDTKALMDYYTNKREKKS